MPDFMPLFTDPVAILAVLCLNILLAELIVKRTSLSHLGTAFTTILLTAITANLGLIPSSSPATPLYDGIFSYVAPISIFFLMLSVNLNSLRKAGARMLLMFLVGTVGTLIGALVAMWAVSGKESIGALFYALGGMFTGTYIGGSINFNAVALHYGVSNEGTLFAAATAADNILSAIWIAATIAIPKLFMRWFPRQKVTIKAQQEDLSGYVNDEETVNPQDLSVLLLLGFGSIYLSKVIVSWLPQVPSVLILTTIALALAQVPAIHRLRGNKLLGLFCVYLFLAVIGAYCDIPALLKDGELAITLLVFVTILVLVHAIIIFGVGALFRQDWDIVGIASQANIGGSASAMACAKSLGREDLALPAILIGALGNASGTYWGILIAELMHKWM